MTERETITCLFPPLGRRAGIVIMMPSCGAAVETGVRLVELPAQPGAASAGVTA